MAQHLKQVHGGPYKYPCLAEFCAKMFYTHGELFNHYRQIHLDENEKLKVFDEKQALDDNKTVDNDGGASGGADVQILECGRRDKKSFPSKDRLDKHSQKERKYRKHSDKCSTPVKCKECPKLFNSRSGLQKHTIVHNLSPESLTCI